MLHSVVFSSELNNIIHSVYTVHAATVCCFLILLKTVQLKGRLWRTVTETSQLKTVCPVILSISTIYNVIIYITKYRTAWVVTGLHRYNGIFTKYTILYKYIQIHICSLQYLHHITLYHSLFLAKGYLVFSGIL